MMNLLETMHRYGTPPLPVEGIGGCSVTPVALNGLEGRLVLPALPGGARYFLRMDGVGCYAEVQANGAAIARHTGGHTAWACPLEGFSAGDEIALTLTLAGGENVFSPHQRAGVLRGVSLVALPCSYIAGLSADAAYLDGAGVLRLTYRLGGEAPSPVSLTARLDGADGQPLQQWTLDPHANEIELPCPDIQGWSAESPALYTLTLELSWDGCVREAVRLHVGFTAIDRADPMIYWNGAPLKLLGVNYREPTLSEGRDLAAELTLLKEANVNFLRSLYAPFSEECLTLCDQLGFYVEQCAPLWGVGQEIAATQNTPDDAAAYLSQFAETLLPALSHPCVALWSLGGDSTWGSNFRQGYRLVKAIEARRPVTFHYPMTMPEEEPELDIWPVTYVDHRQPMDTRYDQMIIFHTHGAHNEIGYEVGSAPQSAKPVLHAAFALPPCYNRDEIARDPGIHEFWGESILRFAEKMRATPGCLGGAVMAAVDEDGTFSPRLAGHHWGVLDAKGHPKPEYHHLKMAFAGEAPRLPGPQEAMPTLPVDDPYTLSEDALSVQFSNRRFHFRFSKAAGLLTEAACEGASLLIGGPFLQATRLTLPTWKGRIERAEITANGSKISLLGQYGAVLRARFTLSIGMDGSLRTRCDILTLSRHMPHSVKAGIGIDPGGLNELGIAYIAAPDCQSLCWARNTLWARYPEDHIGRAEGIAQRADVLDFSSMKHHIRRAALSYPKGRIEVWPEGPLSLRLEEMDDPLYVLDDRNARIQYHGLWREMDDACGNFADTESLSDEVGASFRCDFTGTGIRVYGPKDFIYGLGEASVDRCAPVRFSQYLDAVDLPGASRGYEKRYGLLLYEATGLLEGPHTLTVRVLGEKPAGAQGAYVSLDRIVIESEQAKKPLRLILNTDFNYCRLVRGNYMRDRVTLAAGDSLSATLRLSGLEGGNNA